MPVTADRDQVGNGRITQRVPAILEGDDAPREMLMRPNARPHAKGSGVAVVPTTEERDDNTPVEYVPHREFALFAQETRAHYRQLAKSARWLIVGITVHAVVELGVGTAALLWLLLR